MPGEQAAEVRSIYRVGDRVLVKAPFGYVMSSFKGTSSDRGGFGFTASGSYSRLGSRRVTLGVASPRITSWAGRGLSSLSPNINP